MVSRTVRTGRIALAALAAALLLAPGALAAESSASPEWVITSYASPTHLLPPTNTAQAITVKTTGAGGSVWLKVPGYGGFFASAKFSPTASVREVQEALEGLEGLAGNVEVTGGPGDPEGTKPYVVTFAGKLAGERVPTMTVLSLGFPNPETEGATVEMRHEGGSGGGVIVTAVNVGGAATDGSPVTIRDTLPAGLEASAISGLDSYSYLGVGEHEHQALTCAAPPVLQCTDAATVAPGDSLVMTITVNADEGAPETLVNQASVSGGGAANGASTSDPLSVNEERDPFGFAPGSVFTAVSSHQAGGHPDVTAGFAMTSAEFEKGNLKHVPVNDPKDVLVDMPPGLVGNTVGMPKCTAANVVKENCPLDTIVGVASTESSFLGSPRIYVNPVFDIAPAPGEPAAFMFDVDDQAPTRLDTSVLSNGNYAVRVTAGNLSQAEPLSASYVTIWGVPAEHQGPGAISVKGDWRGAGASEGAAIDIGGPSATATPVPLLSNPTQCSTALSGTAQMDSWRHPGVFISEAFDAGTLTGCDLLAFGASMSMLPDTLAAGQPAGYSLALHVPETNQAGTLATALVQKVVTTLPMGTVISPSAAWGLAACTNAQFFGSERGVQSPANPAECPDASQVGTVSISTPALPLPLTGDVYLATPECDPCTPQDAQDGKMVRLFVQVVGEGESGIVVKLEGKASVNQQTGQITATFEDDPQLPFSDFKLKLGGGSRATLANPRACGPAATTMALTPWSTPFTAEVSPVSTFEVNQACIGPQFKPSFESGTTNDQAGEYSPFTVSFGRTDADEFLEGLQMQMPPGLLGSLSGTPLCKEPQAAQGTCSAESLIGHVQVLTGPGATPFLVTGGRVFLTESYKGAPYGLSIVVPAVAGPYTLAGTTGKGTVVVRAAINVDPHTAALTVTSDRLPTQLDGIPLQLKVVNVTIDRPDFTLNPTDCKPMGILGTLSSKEGGRAVISSPFQATNCAALAFKPKFVVSTSGKTSRRRGASLDARVIYPKNAVGKVSNIAKVKVELPRQLPSRLTTLQKACPSEVFAADPASCPAGSVVGAARANTPILPVQLQGPVYFVSYGGAKFPELVIVLQGYGVRVDLHGETFISSKGITSSTFKSVPDVPIESFELYLPEGRDSALAANGNLCRPTRTITVRKRVKLRHKGHVVHRKGHVVFVKRKLKRRVAGRLLMPTRFVGQNGAEIREQTPIAVTGCGGKKAKGGARSARHHRRARAAGRARRDGRDMHSKGRSR